MSEIETPENDSHTLRAMFRELVKRNGPFDVDAAIKTQFADVIAYNEKWARRIAQPRRDWAAEQAEDKGEIKPEIEVIYWQTARFPRLRALADMAALMTYSPRSKAFGYLYNISTYFSGNANARLHKKLVRTIGQDWRLGLIWKVATETACGEHGKVTVTEGFTGWSIALKDGKFPGRNIPRIAFARVDYK
ncbi:MAG: hypothetical protein KGQ41_07540 [Alphaproteobacteria bacterium]|nr:hypothetical protein [Alphaproteobacteria bacterium]